MADDLTDAQKAEFKVAFDKYQTGDNLPGKKISVAIRELGFAVTGSEIQDYFKVAGIDVSGAVDINGFNTIMAAKLARADNPDDIIAAFKGFDPDSDSMSEARFKQIMTQMGAKLNEEEITELLKEVSEGGNVKFEKLKQVVLM